MFRIILCIKVAFFEEKKGKVLGWSAGCSTLAERKKKVMRALVRAGNHPDKG